MVRGAAARPPARARPAATPCPPPNPCPPPPPLPPRCADAWAGSSNRSAAAHRPIHRACRIGVTVRTADPLIRSHQLRCRPRTAGCRGHTLRHSVDGFCDSAGPATGLLLTDTTGQAENPARDNAAAGPRVGRRAPSRSFEVWLGGMDSNHDSQIQSLMSCQLDDLPAGGGQNKTPRIPSPRDGAYTNTLCGERIGVNSRTGYQPVRLALPRDWHQAV